MCVASFFEASSFFGDCSIHLQRACKPMHIVTCSGNFNFFAFVYLLCELCCSICPCCTDRFWANWVPDNWAQGLYCPEPNCPFFRADCWRGGQLAPVSTVPVPVQLSMAKFALNLFLSCIFFVFFTFDALFISFKSWCMIMQRAHIRKICLCPPFNKKYHHP